MSDLEEEDEGIAGETKLSPSERLRLAKKKREQQLKRYYQHEKQIERDSSKKTKKKNSQKSSSLIQQTDASIKKKIQFVTRVKLLESACRNDLEEVRTMLEEGADANSCNIDGLTALHQCCIENMKEMLNLFIRFGADVNAVDSELWTPLHAAGTCGCLEICRILVNSGANLLAVNADGNMPYDICEQSETLDYLESEMSKRGVTQELIESTRLVREKEMLEELRTSLSLGTNLLEYRGIYDETLLHAAASNGHVTVCEFLISTGMSVDVVDAELWQPLHCAACWAQTDVVEVLLLAGAKLEAETKLGETVLDICDNDQIREEILNIKKEVDKQKVSKERRLSRKQSSTLRSNSTNRSSLSLIYNSSGSIFMLRNSTSASVRRTSMREKKEISSKEAREEGKMLSISVRPPSIYKNFLEVSGDDETNFLLLPQPHDIGGDNIQEEICLMVSDASSPAASSNQVDQDLNPKEDQLPLQQLDDEESSVIKYTKTNMRSNDAAPVGLPTATLR